MSDPGLSGVAESLQMLRQQGAQSLDPARFHYLEVLAQRMASAPLAVQPVLEGKLNAALADYTQRFQRGPGATASRAESVPPTALAELNQYISATTQNNAAQSVASPSAREPQSKREMRSVRRFRETWSKIAVVNQVDKAIERGPENAGPLNSHTLVLRSLSLMRGLSPDYLRRFVSHVDALLWLEQESQRQAPAEAKPVRKSRAKK